MFLAHLEKDLHQLACPMATLKAKLNKVYFESNIKGNIIDEERVCIHSVEHILLPRKYDNHDSIFPAKFGGSLIKKGTFLDIDQLTQRFHIQLAHQIWCEIHGSKQLMWDSNVELIYQIIVS